MSLAKAQLDSSVDATVMEVSEVSKSFPGLKALDHVSLKLKEGEVHALVGENGAGKSTLIKIISGALSPDEGVIRIRGEGVVLSSPRDAFRRGISVVHQERNLVPTFTVGENILIERITERAMKVVKKDLVHREAQEFMDMVGLEVSPYREAEYLTAGQKQLAEIARALSSRAKILLLDEPTASISLKEASKLLDIIRRLQKQGISIIYVSHKLEEVFEIADSVTVLRDGRNAGPTLAIQDLDRDKLVTLMVGRSEKAKRFPVRDLAKSEPILEVKDLRSKQSPKRNSFTLNRGEILGWYGLVGAGRTELARLLIGADPPMGGEIRLKGAPVKIRSVSEALHRWSIGYLSENRNEEGLFLLHPIVRNIAASIWTRICSRVGLLNLLTEKNMAEHYQKRLEIQTPSVWQLVNNLSGGNRQKVNIAKVLATKPNILIIDEPTVGIDVKTKQEFHELIWELSKEGISIILISSDMPEIIQLADRILVFREGQICGGLSNTKDYGSMSKRIMELIVANPKETTPVMGGD